MHTTTRTPFEPVVDRIEAAEVLDAPGRWVGSRVRELVAPQALKEALSGTWLGHALHPVLTDVVIGSLLSATLLDLFGDDGPSGERLIAVGLAAYVPTALTGANDWADTEPASDPVRRIGLVHAATNAAALSLYTASLAARRRGARRRGALLAAGGAVALTAAGFLGGEMSFARGVGPAETVYDPGPTDWTLAADASVLAEGRPTRVVVDETPVLVLRRADRFYAIHDRCSHRGCSLSQGELDGDEIVCACHGSRFDLRDGSLRRGPATAPQPAFQTRLNGGLLEVRRLR
jgi:nitrite reductase/ring-hydroxylating ferredoxin subunit